MDELASVVSSNIYRNQQSIESQSPLLLQAGADLIDAALTRDECLWAGMH